MMRLAFGEIWECRFRRRHERRPEQRTERREADAACGLLQKCAARNRHALRGVEGEECVVVAVHRGGEIGTTVQRGARLGKRKAGGRGLSHLSGEVASPQRTPCANPRHP